MFFFFYYSSGATCVYLIINACGLHFNSSKLIIFKTWIKELRCPFMVFCVCVSPALLNYVCVLVKHASKRRLKIIPLAHFKMQRLREHNIPYCLQTYDLNPFHLLFFKHPCYSELNWKMHVYTALKFDGQHGLMCV